MVQNNRIVKRLKPCLRIALLTVLSAGFALASMATRYNPERSASAAQDVSFAITRLPEDPQHYSLVISDTDERVVSRSYSIDQLQVLRSIMLEAEKFSMSEESAGGKKHPTTRFMDNQEQAFIVDVQKAGTQSLFFLTLKTDTGLITWPAGRLIRTTRREEGLFFDLLSKLDSILPKPPVRH